MILSNQIRQSSSILTYTNDCSEMIKSRWILFVAYNSYGQVIHWLNYFDLSMIFKTSSQKNNMKFRRQITCSAETVSIWYELCTRTHKAQYNNWVPAGITTNTAPVLGTKAIVIFSMFTSLIFTEVFKGKGSVCALLTVDLFALMSDGQCLWFSLLNEVD